MRGLESIQRAAQSGEPLALLNRVCVEPRLVPRFPQSSVVVVPSAQGVPLRPHGQNKLTALGVQCRNECSVGAPRAIGIDSQDAACLAGYMAALEVQMHRLIAGHGRVPSTFPTPGFAAGQRPPEIGSQRREFSWDSFGAGSRRLRLFRSRGGVKERPAWAGEAAVIFQAPK